MKQPVKKLVTASIIFFSAASLAAERLALVIGNSDYVAFSPLTNPHYDAQRVAKRLKELGFDVTLRENLTRGELQKELAVFNKKISRNTEISLLFYAGHGISVGGESYLLPVDLQITSDKNYTQEEQYSDKGIGARYLIDKIASAGAQTNIMIFDACRNLPTRSGSNTFHVSGQNLYASTLIAYSAQSGQRASDGEAGENSPYTRALLKYLGTPNLSILDTFNAVNSEVNSQAQMAEMTLTSLKPVILRVDHSAPAIQPPKKSPVNDNAWMERLWAWADEFGIPAEELPRNKKDLLALQKLDLSGNQLQSLPPEIGQLTNLQALDLSSNQLQSLPPEIGQLNNLQALDLFSNQLQSLPPEIGQLNNLQWLNFGINQLQSLPPGIGQLNNLQTFGLWGNQLQSLPKTFTQLKNLIFLDIAKNPNLKLTREQNKFISGIKTVNR